MAWIGSGFGISPDLLKFWTRNGFLPIHMTPHRKEISGEHSVVMLKALTDDLDQSLKEINSHFIKRFMEYLGDELRDIDTHIATASLDSLTVDGPVPPPIINEADRKRMEKYLEGMSLYEYVSDIIKPVTKYYFSRAERVTLTEQEQKIVVGKCLQHRTWKEVDNQYETFRNAIRKIWKAFAGG